ncbi:MAG TPA: HAD family hydrolase [Nitrospiraceae bacterium]|nr:HAD family hydrolase [Nitrospiraceae bacterium]
MAPQAVIFDIDGTLLDSVTLHAQAWVEAFAHFGYQTKVEEVRPQIGKGGDQLMPVFVPAEDLKRIGKELEEYRKNLFKKKFLPQVRPFPKVRELFLKMQERGLQIALASSGKEEEVAAYKRIAGIEDLVEEETSSDDAKRSKPHPDIFHAALDKLVPLKPDQILAVGDTPYDAEAAGKAGLKTIGMLCGGHSEQVLKQAGCIAIYQDPADLFVHYDESPLAAS